MVAGTSSLSETPPAPIDRVIGAMMRTSGGYVGRQAALQIPAVSRGRDLICALAALPLREVDVMTGMPMPASWLDQIDPDVANVVVLSQILEDLIFDGIAWLEVVDRDPYGFPAHARRRDPSMVKLQPPGDTRGQSLTPAGADPRGSVWVDGREVASAAVIRIDAAAEGLLVSARETLRRAQAIDRLITMYAESYRPMDYFTPAPDSPDLSAGEITAVLDDWSDARRRHAAAYVPRELAYNAAVSVSPADAQLAERERTAAVAVANHLGVDPEDMGVSTTTRTYANVQDRRQDRINDTLAPYMLAISQRLSMGDATYPGRRVSFDTTGYLRANSGERVAYYQGLKAVGADVTNLVAEREGVPMAETPEPAPAPDPVDLSGDVAVVTFAAPAGVATGARTVYGVIVPWNTLTTWRGLRLAFAPGSVTWSDPARVALLRDHAPETVVGAAAQLETTPGGLSGAFRVADGDAGDEVLSLTSAGVLTGLSGGLEFDLARDAVPHPTESGAWLVLRATLREASLTAVPAYDDARITGVDLSRSNAMHCTQCGQVHTGPCAAQPAHPQPASVQPPQPAPAGATQPAQPPATPEPAGVTLSAQQLAGLLVQLYDKPPEVGPAGAGAQTPQLPVPTPVDPHHSPVQVVEPVPYRFDARGRIQTGTHDFSSDVISGLRDGDRAAYDRAMTAVARLHTFDVDTTDVAGMNPTRQRPDMYVDQLDYVYPLWDSVNKGALSDVTPFTFPKFNSSSGLVSDHVQGTEPTAGAFTATTQTVTPTALSGRVEITREVWDQGGNPQVSGLIWAEMVREWNEELESATATFLNTLTAATDIALTTAAVDEALASQWDAAMASLQFIRGGHRLRMFGVHIDLYKAFADARDADGRPLYPMLGPSNTNGTSAPRFGTIDLGGVTGVPSWALGATGTASANSWLFNPADVHGWASPPQRLSFEYRVAYVDLAVWGYKAFANSRIAGVRQVTYDPVA